jgi:hypothetical protein
MQPMTLEVITTPRTTLRLHRDAEGRRWARLFRWHDEAAAFLPYSDAEELDLSELPAIYRANIEAMEADG